MQEKLVFEISNNTIYHLIQAQAGTIGKALCELVQNAQDAGSDSIHFSVDINGFAVKDTGIGFKSKDEIVEYFGTLGFEHNSDLHTADNRVGMFGIGRSQIFCFAPTTWITNGFQMVVDIKNKGLSYAYSELSTSEQGCQISGQWYEPLSFADLKEVVRELEALVCYASINVYINERIINKQNVKWDLETDTVCVRRKETGGLSVYNLGYLIRTYPAHQFGSGIVVSKQRFMLNMARNDILTAQCELWKEVRAFLKKDLDKRTQGKQKLTDDEKQFAIDRLVSGETGYRQYYDVNLLEDVTGRPQRLDRLHGETITVHTTENQLLAERIHRDKVAFVMSSKMIELFGADNPQHLAEILSQILHLRKIRFIPLADLLPDEDSSFILLKDKELTKNQLVTLRALRVGMGLLEQAANYAKHRTYYSDTPARKLFIGDSNGQAAGWTNGSTYIALDKQFVDKHVRDGWRGFTAMINVICHEACHDIQTDNSHVHSPEFYETFHDILCEQHSPDYGTALRKIMAHFLKLAQKEGCKLSRNELRDFDREIQLERDVYDHDDFLRCVNAELASDS